MMDEDMAKAQGQSLDAFVEEVEQNVPATEAEAATTTPVLSLSHEVRHEVAIPDGYPYVPLSQHKYLDPPAKSYPFTLDPFQRLAVGCIERNESVLVSAHTSAGKTVCAEYAIATALRDKQRVIYTSPIKALSNQKYRELQEEFGDVGLMTGDVTINPEASCLVMTTEILRSMLYRGSEVMREVAWVVFDEIHYMRDKERGVVWEETLILLPDAVHYVFLSATIPNALQFARWVSANHRQPCHVVYTNYRPTPLQHYIFPQGGDGLYLVVDEKAVFREENFRKALNLFADQPGGGALEVLGEASRKRRRQNQAKGGPAGPSDLFKIVRMIMTKNYQPCIVFSFSKRECESNAMLVAKLDFNLEEEKRLVAGVFANALESLSEEDRALPQIEGILPLLKRGIGVHHSGLLPILKEVIEILFQEGLIKVLFATETFSIGLNMPARTVVFTSVRKFDGKETRWVSSGEYIQMSGRAGRRGLDSRGIVLLMLEERMEPAVCKRMLKGAADALNSAFHLSYNMILNLMRVEGVSPEYMLERSFFQFQSGDAIPALQAEVEGLVREHDGLRLEGGEAEETAVTQFHELRSQLEALRSDFRAVVHHQAYALPFLQPGRLVRVRDGPSDFGWAVLVALQKRAPRPGKDAALGAGPTHVLDVLLFCRKPDAVPGSATPQPCPAGERGEMLVHPVSLAVLDGISSVRISLPPDLKPYDHRATVFKTVCEVERRFPDGLPLLDPLEDMGIRDPAFRQLVEKIERLETALHAHPLYGSARLPGLYRAFQAKLALAERIAALRRHIRDAQAIVQMDELKARKRVLRRLGFADEHDVILVKGRVACEISTGDELLLTEMVFAGVFNPLSPEQTVALLSCFVFEERADESPKLKEELAGPLRAMQDTARRIAAVSQECRLPLPEAEYLERFRPELMDVVHAWCKGAPFARICRMTDVFEGSIIRCLRRLEELLRQMAQAAKSIGNAELEAKFTEGIARMKRDIVFANSLYL
jgi:ATP-dependent RNA helicase DOB1